jgi:SNF2 family DNA or RNA helicase
MCRVNHNLDEIQIQVVNNFIHRVQRGELSGCHKCGIQLQTLFVIPCGHLVCTECINNTTTLCPVCQAPFDVDDFQRLQPGLDNQFCLNLQEEKKERESRFALKRAFAESSRSGRPSGAADSLLGVAAVSSARSHKKGESCVYSSLIHDGKCTVCREEHYECDFMNTNKQCSLCFKYAEECPVYNQKALYVIEKLLRLRENHRTNCSPMAVRLFATSGADQSRHRPLKAIVFSQFRAIYEYFGDKLIRRFGGACVADYSYGGTRTQELQKFIYQPECFVMLLSKQGAVGLDLSFVTHIFFLDSVFDASLRTQVVARAYRMGATGSVCVEQLTAKNTIEEVMNEMNNAKQIDQSTSDANSNPAEKHAKLHQLLISAKLIRPLQKSTMKKRKVMEDATDVDDQSKSSGVRFKD